MQNELLQKLLAKWNAFSKTQKLTIVLCAILAIVLVVGIGVMISSLGRTKDTLGTESTQGTESFVTEEVFSTEEELATEEVFGTETTELEEVTETIEVVNISMTTTSIEKDLKVKIVDDNNALVTGHVFVIVVTPEGKNTGTEYRDDNMNGIIHIKSLAAGKYTVQLQEMEGFIPTENPISTVVKDKIVYQKVEIENEIKDESEIDASKEDTANKGVEVEEEISNTLPLLESTVTTTVVKKDKVDFSNFPEAVVSEDSSQTILASAKASLPKTIMLYSSGKEASKTVNVQLNLVDQLGVVKDILWSVDDAEKVNLSVAEDKLSVLLSAKKEGKVKLSVIVSYEANESEAVSQTEGDEGNLQTSQIQTKEIICEVTVGDYTDDKTQLQDVNGNFLFLDKEAKHVATQKAFSAAEQFYANPQYTGWQTINGKLYYYKADHTYATGRQVIGGVTYDFNTDGTLIEKEETMGIDVSKWNGDVDWKAVAGAGVDFAIIRCGYRGSSTGTLVEDPYFKQNIAGATANGIKVGVYFFTQAITEAEAVEEASMAISLVKGYHLQLPVFIDTEGSGGRGDKLNKTERTSVVKAFCETVKAAGYKAGVYASRSWYMDNLNAEDLSSYHIWVARYAKECGYTGHYDIWQYTDSGTIPGIKGKVDLNIGYTGYY